MAVDMSYMLKSGRKERTVWSLLFLGGFLIGIALVCLTPQRLVWSTDFLDIGSIGHLKSIEMNRNGLFLYSLKSRIGMGCLLVFLSMAGIGGIASHLFLGWSGLSVGVMTSVLSMRYGLRGMLLFCASVLPQQLLLVPGFFLLLDYCIKRGGKWRLLFPFGIILAGCFLEGYINPAVMKVVLQLF